MKTLLGTMFAIALGLTGCSVDDATASDAGSAASAPRVASLTSILRRRGSWCDAKKNEVSLGHGYVYVTRETTDIAPEVEPPVGTRGEYATEETDEENRKKAVYVTFCAQVGK